MRKMCFQLILGSIICLFLVWSVSVIRCEVITYQHKDEFHMILDSVYDDSFNLKVLEYNQRDSARIYCISKDKAYADVLRVGYDLENDCWHVYDYVGGWSKTGNADDIVYPYIWHLLYWN